MACQSIRPSPRRTTWPRVSPNSGIAAAPCASEASSFRVTGSLRAARTRADLREVLGCGPAAAGSRLDLNGRGCSLHDVREGCLAMNWRTSDPNLLFKRGALKHAPQLTPCVPAEMGDRTSTKVARTASSWPTLPDGGT